MTLRHAALLLALLCSCCRFDADLPSKADCAAILANADLPETLEEVTRLRAAGSSWTNAEIRSMYACRALDIGLEDARWEASGVDLATRARRAYEIRRNARLVARAMMSDSSEVSALQARDQAKYGSPDGPSWDWLVQHQQEEGRQGDDALEAILESSQRTEEMVSHSSGP